MKSRKILALLMMPPPVHGASNINQKMVEFLIDQGAMVSVINTVPSSMAIYYNGSIWKILRLMQTFIAWFRVLAHIRNPPDAIYIGISGGIGQLMDCMLAYSIRMMNVPVFVHHHSFAYITKNAALFKLFCYLMRSVPVTHLVLCEEMGERLCSRYSNYISKSQILVLSNAAFFPYKKRPANNFMNKSVLRVGYISNITMEKGIDDVVHLFKEVVDAEVPIDMTVAGPCNEETVQHELCQLAKEHNNFHYLGPVYGDAKEKFYNSIDVLIFPTRYINEAEPLIIYEAAVCGVPTIANARGCIAAMVSRCGGWPIYNDNDFVSEAFIIIKKIIHDDMNNEMRDNAINGSRFLFEGGQSALKNFIKKITLHGNDAAA